MKNANAIGLLFTANIISGMAQGISIIAIPWYLANMAGRPQLLAEVYLITTLCSIFWSPYAGILIDKYNRRNIFIGLSAVVGTILLSVAFTGFQMGEVPLLLVAVVFTATFLNFNLHYPNLYAFAQEITEPQHYSKITSWIEIQGQLSNALAGAFAAILLEGTTDGMLNLFGFEIPVGFEIQAWELHHIFLMDGCTYAIGILIISMIRFTPIRERKHEAGTIPQRMKAGLMFFKDHPIVFLFGFATMATFLTIIVNSFLILPSYISGHLNAGPGVYAANEMYFALGSLCAGLLIRFTMRMAKTLQMIIILTAITGCIYLMMFFNTAVPVFYLCIFILGFSNAGTRILRTTWMFNHVPNEVIGRVSGVFIMLHIIGRAMLIGLFSLPLFLSQGGNIALTMLVFFGIIIVSLIVMLLNYRRVEELPVN